MRVNAYRYWYMETFAVLLVIDDSRTRAKLWKLRSKFNIPREKGCLERHCTCSIVFAHNILC